jgi:hypothetical protein
MAEITLNGDNPQQIPRYSLGSYGEGYDPGATAVDDNGNSLQVVVSGTSSVDLNTLGTYNWVYNALNSNGNALATEVRVVVVVNDYDPPIITIDGPEEAHIQKRGEYQIPSASAIDNTGRTYSDSDITKTHEINNQVEGRYGIKYSVTDPSDNEGVAWSYVIVDPDTEAPTGTLYGDNPDYVLQNSSTSYLDPGCRWTDNVFSQYELINFETTSNVNIQVIGEYTVTYKATDPDGNTGIATRSVIVTDSIKPQILIIGNNPYRLYAEPGINYIDPGAFVVDNYDQGRIIQGTGFVDMEVPGSYLIRYNASDAAGNQADEVQRTVTILEPPDQIPPAISITGPNPLTVEVNTVYIDPGASANDVVDGIVPVTVVNLVNPNQLGVYQVEYTARDSKGNVNTAYRVVNVVDTTPPVLSLNGSYLINLRRKQRFQDNGATFQDNYDAGKIIYANNLPNILIPGVYTLRYRTSDMSGNVSNEVTRSVVVQPDTEPPILYLGGSEARPLNQDERIYLTTGQTYREIEVLAYDLIDGERPVQKTGTLNVEENGKYEIVYSATDESGNTSTYKRIITVSSLEEDPISPSDACGQDETEQSQPCQIDIPSQAGIGQCTEAPTADNFCRACGTEIWGCTDKVASNFNFRATKDDGSCVYPQPPQPNNDPLSPIRCDRTYTVYVGDPLEIQFSFAGGSYNMLRFQNPLPYGLNFLKNDLKIVGAMTSVGVYQNSLIAENSAGSAYCNFTINVIDRTQKPGVLGCTDLRADNYSPTAEIDDGSCIYKGCMDPSAANYEPRATIPDFCVYYGCTDPEAINYDNRANTYDGSCRYCTPANVTLEPFVWESPLTLRGTYDNVVSIIVEIKSIPPLIKLAVKNEQQKKWEVTFTQAELEPLPGGTYEISVVAQAPCPSDFPPTKISRIIGKTQTKGCKDPKASNYDPEADIGDASLCEYGPPPEYYTQFKTYSYLDSTVYGRPDCGAVGCNPDGGPQTDPGYCCGAAASGIIYSDDFPEEAFLNYQPQATIVAGSMCDNVGTVGGIEFGDRPCPYVATLDKDTTVAPYRAGNKLALPWYAANDESCGPYGLYGVGVKWFFTAKQ